MAFEQAASALEQRQKLKRILLSASVYPAVVFVMTAFLLVVLLTVIVSRFQQVFLRMDLPLPPMTQKVFQWSSAVLHYWPCCVVAVFLLAILWFCCSTRPSFCLVRDGLWWRFLLFGALKQKASLARAMTVLSHGLETGVPFLESLGLAARASGDAKMAHNLDRLAQLTRQGSSLARAARSEKLLPLWCIGLLEAGETTGKLSSVTRRIGAQCMEEQEASMKILPALLEPLMLVSVGLVVAVVVWAVFSPILSAVNNLTL